MNATPIPQFRKEQPSQSVIAMTPREASTLAFLSVHRISELLFISDRQPPSRSFYPGSREEMLLSMQAPRRKCQAGTMTRNGPHRLTDIGQLHRRRTDGVPGRKFVGSGFNTLIKSLGDWAFGDPCLPLRSEESVPRPPTR